MAKIVQKLLLYRPAAVFLDFDLAQPSNENGLHSEGDMKLLEVLQKAQFPILLPDGQAIAQPLKQAGPNLYQVDARVLYDGDGQTRWVPRAEPNQPLPTALALYCLGQGTPAKQLDHCRGLAGSSGSAGKRIVFREIRRFPAGTEGSQLWPGLVVMSGLELLNDGLVQSPQTEGAIFLVGRSFPVAADVHFTPIGPVQGIDIHANALMTLATYRHFSETLSWGPLLGLVSLLVFLALWITYSITDGWLKLSRFQDFIKSLIEAAIAAWFLFFAGVVIVQYYGYFLDYLFPIAAFHLTLLSLKLRKGGKKHEVVVE
jgi:CHASE2 domain-containing sensor protein